MWVFDCKQTNRGEDIDCCFSSKALVTTVLDAAKRHWRFVSYSRVVDVADATVNLIGN